MSDDSSSLFVPGSGSNQYGNRPANARAIPAQPEHVLAVAWRRLLLGIVLFEIPLPLDTYLYHSAEEAQFGAISGYNLSLTTICLFFLYIQWLPRAVVESASIIISKTLFAFLTITVFSLFFAQDTRLASYELFLLLQAFLLFTYVANNIATRLELMFVVSCLMAGLLVQGVMMTTTKILDTDIGFGPVLFEFFSGDNRVVGSFGSPNVAASYLALFIPLGLGVLFSTAPTTLRLISFIAFFSGSLGLILTMSRGGWLAAGIVCTIYFIATFRSRQMPMRIPIIVSIGLVTMLFVFQNLFITRIFGEDHGSALSRFPLIQISNLMIADHPLGVGANNWAVAAQPYTGLSKFREEWFFTVHNKYLLIWTEVGLLGLLAYLAFLFSTLKTGWRSWKGSDRLLAPIALGCTAAIAGQMIHMSLDIFNHRAQVQMLWLVAALVVAIGNLSNKKESNRSLAVQ